MSSPRRDCWKQHWCEYGRSSRRERAHASRRARDCGRAAGKPAPRRLGLAAVARRARTRDHARQRAAGRQRAVAPTQAEIGALIVAELHPALDDRPIACVLTHVRVAAEDPAFHRPTKPIGPFYSAEQGEQLERERGWAMVSDANRGYRRVVPSPLPLEVVELSAIRLLA